MKSFNICIDIDGTITDPYYWLEQANKYFKRNITEEQVTEYEINKVMGITLEEYETFYEKNKWMLHSEQKLRQEVKPILRKLNMLHNLHFVTARDKSLRMLTYGYLKKNGIPFDSLYVLGSHYKVRKAQELACDVFIEDSYDNAIQLSNAGYKVLLLDTYYNRKQLNENIVRVKDWNEIHYIINELLLQDKAM